MITHFFKVHYWPAMAGCLLVGFLLIGAGCGRGGGAPEALPVGQVAPTIEKEFKNAQADLRSAVDMALAALKTNDIATAYVVLRNLSSSPDLSEKQRLAITRSMLTVNEKVREAAAKGDGKAGEVLQLQMNK